MVDELDSSEATNVGRSESPADKQSITYHVCIGSIFR